MANVTVVPEPKGYQKRSCQLGITVEPLQVFDLVSVWSPQIRIHLHGGNDVAQVPWTPSHFIKTVSIRQSAIRPLPFPYQVMSMVGSLWLKNKSTCGTINPYAGHVASHGHVGHVMVKLPCETWWHVISMLDMSWSNSYWNMTIHEHIEHIIGKLPCDTLARHELAKLLVNLTSDMLWDMLGFFIFKLTSSNFEQILLTE